MNSVKVLILCIFLFVNYNPLMAGPSIYNNQDLNNKQKSIVAIASLAAKGNLAALKPALHAGLDAGMTVNEIKEILVQVYAYCGFPRSLNAINTFITVSKEREAKGIRDPLGLPPAPVSDTNKYEVGRQNLEELTGRKETGAKTGYAAFVPIIDTFLKEHLFADIFGRGVLTNAERELTTISMLASLGGVESQLQGHMSISISVGISEAQISHMLNIIETSIGKMEAVAGRVVLSKVVAGRHANQP